LFLYLPFVRLVRVVVLRVHCGAIELSIQGLDLTDIPDGYVGT
jgi:hypothetical protein